MQLGSSDERGSESEQTPIANTRNRSISRPTRAKPEWGLPRPQQVSLDARQSVGGVGFLRTDPDVLARLQGLEDSVEDARRGTKETDRKLDLILGLLRSTA